MIDQQLLDQLKGWSDRQVMAATIYGEARGEGTLGLDDVANVIMTRVGIANSYHLKHNATHPLFGDGTVRSACLMPFQFSCWNRGDPNRDKLVKLHFERPDTLLAQCVGIAEDAMLGRLPPDRTGGATTYKTSSLPWPKAWGPEIAPTLVDGHQSFYRLA